MNQTLIIQQTELESFLALLATQILKNLRVHTPALHSQMEAARYFDVDTFSY